MKRVFFVMVFIVALVSLNAAYVFPGWHLKDAALFEEQFNQAPSLMAKVFCKSMVTFIQTPPATFDELKTVVEAYATEFKTVESDTYIMHLVKIVAYNKGINLPNRATIIKDAFAYCIANPGNGDQNFLTLPAEMLGITEETKNKMTYEAFIKDYYMPPSQTLRLVKQYLNYLATADIPNDVAYTQISTLNKIYTNKLVDNPTAWEPVVAHIRTVLEAYQK